MSKKVYLCAGHHNADPGAINTQAKISEASLAKALRDKIATHLTNLQVPHWLDDDRDQLATVVDKLRGQTTEESIIVDLHFNAGPSTATGVEVIIPNRHTMKEREMATKLCSAIQLALSIRNRGVRTEADTTRKKLAIMSPAGTNVLIEVCFISNPSDLKQYLDNHEKVALGIAQVIKEYMK